MVRHASPTRAKPSIPSRIIGGFGELLITAGVLVGLFVVWQAFWTDVQGQQLAAEHNQQFEEAFGDPADGIGEPRYDEPPAESIGPDPWARLYVPRWDNLDTPIPIAEGVDRRNILDRNFAGHYEETALPGEIGNFSLAAHRQSYGKAFYGVHDLQMGDSLIVETDNAFYVYKITVNELIVRPTDVFVIAPNPLEPDQPADKRMMTLTTCHPLWSTAERWIVHAELDHWVDRNDGIPIELSEGV